MMFSAASATTLLLLISIAAQRARAKPVCPVNDGISWLADPDDCSLFYVCHASQRFDFTCGQNVWDQETLTCVGRGSLWDKCTIAKELDELNVRSGSEPCTGSSPNGIFPKSDNCAQYYNCSSRATTVTDNPHVMECQYPFLFNRATKRCDKFEAVTCGARWEPLDACDYVANTCWRGTHCIPCNVRYPSCRGMPNGLNPWVGREPSPYFVLCRQERTLSQGQCANSKGPQLFDAVKRICVKTPKA